MCVCVCVFVGFGCLQCTASKCLQLFSLIQFKSSRYFFLFFFFFFFFFQTPPLQTLRSQTVHQGGQSFFTAAKDYIIFSYCLTPRLLIISKNDLVGSAAGSRQSSSCSPLLAFSIFVGHLKAFFYYDMLVTPMPQLLYIWMLSI